MADPARSLAPHHPEAAHRDAAHPAPPAGATGALVLADGAIAWGHGLGAVGHAGGELCFNTSITGYQEVLSDPSYAGQIVTFTFPHIGNVGVNDVDHESAHAGAVGCVLREGVTAPSNFRATASLPEWLQARGRIGLAGIDTRALTRRIRQLGAVNAVIAHAPDGIFDIPALIAMARDWPGLEGMELARGVTRPAPEAWAQSTWALRPDDAAASALPEEKAPEKPHVVVIDYGVKDNILRNLVRAGARVSVVPATTALPELLALAPAGVLLSNGPGDPAATGAYALPVIQGLLVRDVPIFGICLGHQLLALAAGARTVKMHQGHRGANHPVQRLEPGANAGRVEITAMNHGFAVDNAPGALPDGVIETHRSLFDGSNCGIMLAGKRAFGVQYHPEASPGPMDSFYLFERFIAMLG